MIRPVERASATDFSASTPTTTAARAGVARLALEAMATIAGAALVDPLRGGDRGQAAAFVWAEHGQSSLAQVGGDLRVLAAQSGQSVAGRLSATSPVDAGRIERVLADFARELRAQAADRPHLTPPNIVEPLIRSIAAGLQREPGPGAARGDVVEQFVRIIDGAIQDLRGAPGA
ncbi:hypothetical protein [Caulobacter hibisci]|uniref:Uncharacterized protein n=1 Tax=Caulobacter hibisci TaxID=2035993 RepID=A0ABS0SSW7_9CAUL|nr:hypothetical protein [Caulobacter hibisci]MBI1682714.1 hypothetical protein [Caulobacter hibisci]